MLELNQFAASPVFLKTPPKLKDNDWPTPVVEKLLTPENLVGPDGFFIILVVHNGCGAVLRVNPRLVADTFIFKSHPLLSS